MSRFLAACVDLLAVTSRRAAWVFLLGFLVLGALSVSRNPGFQVPDEDAHWWVALRRIAGATGPLCGAHVGLPFHLEYDRVRWRSHEHMPQQRAEGLASVPVRCTEASIPYGLVTTYPAVLLGDSIFPDAPSDGRVAARYFYFARLVSGLLVALLFWRVIVAYAARGPTPGLVSLSVLLWSPLFVQQSFAVSADGVVNLFAFATVLMCLRAPRLSWLDHAVYVAIGVTATWTKPTIAPLTLVPVVWALAAHVRGWPWRLATWRDLVRGVGRDRARLVLVVISLLLLGSAFAAVLHSGGPGATGASDGVRNSPAQVAYVESNLRFALGAFYSSSMRFLTVRDFAGHLGWLDNWVSEGYIAEWGRLVHLALAADALFVVVLLVAAGQRQRLLGGAIGTATLASAILVGVVASMMVTAFAMYVAFTPYTSQVVDGIQARYLFPSVIVAALAAAAVRLTPGVPTPAGGAIQTASTWVVCGALVMALIGLFARLQLTLWERYW